MIEQGEYNPEIRIEEAVQEVIKYLGSSDTDSVRGQAFLDFDTRIRLLDKRISQIRDLVNTDPSDRSYLELATSNLRITEVRVALLEHSIDYKTAAVPDYKEEYQEAANYHEHIGGVVSDVASDLYPNNDSMYVEYWDREMLGISDRIRQQLLDNKKLKGAIAD